MMNKSIRTVPFNSPLETGVRSLEILVAAYPIAYDLERLVEMDYLVVHSGDFGGPESLHAALPMRAGELLVRRDLIARGLQLMASRDLIRQVPAIDGFNYIAEDAAAPFLASLEASYSIMLRERALWVVDQYADMATSEIRQVTHQRFKNWSSLFQATDRLRGH